MYSPDHISLPQDIDAEFERARAALLQRCADERATDLALQSRETRVVQAEVGEGRGVA